MKTTKTLNELIKEANAQEKVYNKNNIPSVILEKVEELNTAELDNAKKHYASMPADDFRKAFFAVELSANIPEEDLEKAIKESVSVKLSAIKITDTGLIEEATRIKSLSFAEIFSGKLDLLAFAHADKKVTATDRAEAFKHFFGNDGVGYCDLLTHSARKFMSIGTENDGVERFKMTADYVKTFEKVNAEYEKQGKENPFTKMSNTAFSQQITDVINYFMPDNKVKFTAYHTKALFQMVCNRGKYGKSTISDILTVFNALAIVYRYAVNGYKLPTNNRSTIYEK